MVLDSIKSVFALMALIASGFYFAGKPWFGKQGMDFLSKFTMFYNIYKDVGTRESLISLVSKLPVTFGLILLCLALAALMGVLLKVDGKRRYTFVAASGFPNVVFIGFPVIQALWGQGITSIGVIYYIARIPTRIYVSVRLSSSLISTSVVRTLKYGKTASSSSSR